MSPYYPNMNIKSFHFMIIKEKPYPYITVEFFYLWLLCILDYFLGTFSQSSNLL